MVDENLATGLAKLFSGQSVLEFGAGMGCMTGALKDRGVDVRGFEGATNVHQLTQGLVCART